jgi:hypothetical protein
LWSTNRTLTLSFRLLYIFDIYFVVYIWRAAVKNMIIFYFWRRVGSWINTKCLPNPFFVYPDTNPLPWRWRWHVLPKSPC